MITFIRWHARNWEWIDTLLATMLGMALAGLIAGLGLL